MLSFKPHICKHFELSYYNGPMFIYDYLEFTLYSKFKTIYPSLTYNVPRWTFGNKKFAFGNSIHTIIDQERYDCLNVYKFISMNNDVALISVAGKLILVLWRKINFSTTLLAGYAFRKFSIT